jgi:hypothetical protein
VPDFLGQLEHRFSPTGTDGILLGAEPAFPFAPTDYGAASQQVSTARARLAQAVVPFSSALATRNRKHSLPNPAKSPCRRQFRISNSVADIPMPEVILNGSRIVAIARELQGCAMKIDLRPFESAKLRSSHRYATSSIAASRCPYRLVFAASISFSRCGSLLTCTLCSLPVVRRFAKDFRITPENRPSLAALAARVTGHPLPQPIRTVTRVSQSQSTNRMTAHAVSELYGITLIKVTQLDPFDLAGFQEAWRGWADERAVLARQQSRLGKVAVELIRLRTPPALGVCSTDNS